MKNIEKNIENIRSDFRYHICTSYDENMELSEWYLWSSKNLFDKDNKPIMCSKNNTLEELFEFNENIGKELKTRKRKKVIAHIIGLTLTILLITVICLTFISIAKRYPEYSFILGQFQIIISFVIGNFVGEKIANYNWRIEHEQR